MPYIITTRRPFDGDGTTPEDFERWTEFGDERCAVETLDEAQRHIALAVSAEHVQLEGMGDPSAFTPAERAFADDRITESGGIVVLPSGAVVEVESCAKMAMAWSLGLSPRLNILDIIAAFNAAQVSA